MDPHKFNSFSSDRLNACINYPLMLLDLTPPRDGFGLGDVDQFYNTNMQLLVDAMCQMQQLLGDDSFGIISEPFRWWYEEASYWLESSISSGISNVSALILDKKNQVICKRMLDPADLSDCFIMNAISPVELHRPDDWEDSSVPTYHGRCISGPVELVHNEHFFSGKDRLSAATEHYENPPAEFFLGEAVTDPTLFPAGSVKKDKLKGDCSENDGYFRILSSKDLKSIDDPHSWIHF